MAETSTTFAHRVFLPQALGADEYLRVTFHEDEQVLVFSHWRGNVCAAATPVAVTDSPALLSLLGNALGHAATRPGAPSAAAAPTMRSWRARALAWWAGSRRRDGGAPPGAANADTPAGRPDADHTLITPLHWRDSA